MFGGGNRNPVSPFIIRENQSLYDANSSTQLQLFGNFSSGMDPVQGNYHVSDQSLFRSPNKRFREGEDIIGRQNLQIALNTVSREESDRLTSVAKPNPVSTGLRLSYDDDERNSTVTSANGGLPSLPVVTFLGENLKNEFESQTEELDRYLRVQEEHIMKGMRDLKQRHMAFFLSVLEESIGKKLRQKEAEIDNMNRQNRELMEKLKQVSMESQTWHYKACFNESVVSVLKNNIKQAIAQGSNHGREGCGDSEVDDAASSHGSGVAVQPEMACRVCRSGEISVLLLPCRHLCLCKDCGGSVHTCPICQTTTTVVVPVIIS